MYKHNQKDWTLHFWQSKILSSKRKETNRSNLEYFTFKHHQILFDIFKAIIRGEGEGEGQGFSQATVNGASDYFHRKIEEIKPKKIPSCLIPCLLCCIYLGTWDLSDIIPAFFIKP